MHWPNGEFSSSMSRIPLPKQHVTRSFDRDELMRALKEREFVPHPLLRNGHTQTILGNERRRTFAAELFAAERREFTTEHNVRVVAYCSWQTRRELHPTVVIVHGLESSCEASYVLGTGGKALRKGFNVIRYNVRNCGGTEHLAQSLYHSGLTVDLHCVLRELIEVDRLSSIFLIGFSMGGNQALKLAGEIGAEHLPEVKGVCAISPPLDLADCSRAIGRWQNRFYEMRFLRSLRRRMRVKKSLYPESYELGGLERVRSIWDFDELMSPYYGFQNALDYYTNASSGRFIGRIEIPALIIHAQDDPFIPMSGFRDEVLSTSPWIIFLNPRSGGHVAFCARRSSEEDRAWAENRAVQFCSLLAGI